MNLYWQNPLLRLHLCPWIVEGCEKRGDREHSKASILSKPDSLNQGPFFSSQWCPKAPMSILESHLPDEPTLQNYQSGQRTNSQIKEISDSQSYKLQLIKYNAPFRIQMPLQGMVIIKISLLHSMSLPNTCSLGKFTETSQFISKGCILYGNTVLFFFFL